MLIAFALTENYFIAALAGVILLTSPAFVEAARQVRLDATVTLAMLFTVYSFVRGRKNENWYLGIGVGLALGVLTKSVIGLFPIGFIVLWAIAHREFSLPRNKYFWMGVGLMFAIALPWHLYEIVMFEHAFWNGYFVHTVLDRAESNILGGVASNAQYLYFLSTFAAPWSIVFLAGVAAMVFKREQSRHSITEIVLAAFVAIVLAAFLSSATKLAYYLIPLYPFMALFIAIIFGELLKRGTKSASLQTGREIVAVLVLLLGLANTIFVGFDYVNGFHINQVISNEERDVGRLLAATPTEPVYTYNWDYLDTMRYYAGGRKIGKMYDDQVLDESFFLIVHAEFGYQFPPEMQAHLQKVYAGPALTMYLFDL